ncbi:MAG: 50S ribosomal protein L9 [Phycisphaerales bacterium]|nr:50S ribosomal protein L9 [Phycisphaerales bacterium]|tara:strand:- start:12449 stop:13048 length:600 start_codon:yes stop_codon:yes gene_type:complete
MARNIELLLQENVENLGIVGDVVKVKPGFARNFLLPMGVAVVPTPQRIADLEAERTEAMANLAAQKDRRKMLLEKLEGIALTMTRSCNDQGVLYGSVSQRDIADGLQEIADKLGETMDPRHIRVATSIRHIGTYEIPVQFDQELRTDIQLIVEPDQALEEREEMEFDDDGELIEKPLPEAKKEEAETADSTPADEDASA